MNSTITECTLNLAPGFALARGRFAHMNERITLYPGLDLEQREVRMFGKVRPVPRLVAWYGASSYSYSGQTHPAAEMPGWLESLRLELEDACGARFNSVLANYYRDGRDSVAWHADDEPELGKQPTIASVSLGAARRFGIRSRTPKGTGAGSWDIQWLTLEHGDLLVMSGDSQRDYMHCLPKTPAAVGPRLNLTFRFVS